MKLSKLGICYSAYINQDCSPKDLSESISKVYNEFKGEDIDINFYVTIFDPKQKSAYQEIIKLREKENISIRILLEPTNPKYSEYSSKGHSMCNGAVCAYLDNCDYIGFMDGDETIPDGKFPKMIEAMKKFNSDICFVNMPRSVFSGLVTNSFLVYFTSYLDYEVPGFISGYYLLTNELAKKLFHLKDQKMILEYLQNNTDITEEYFMKITDNIDSSIINYRNWAIDTSIVVLSLVEHKANCCSAKVTPKIDRSAQSYSDVGVKTIEDMFNQLIGGISHMIAKYRLNENLPKIPKKPPVFGEYSKKIEHTPIDVEPYKKISQRYKKERKKEYEKITSICSRYFDINPILENLDEICKNHGLLLKELINEIDNENYEFIGSSLVIACMYFMTQRVEILRESLEENKDVLDFSNKIKKKVTENLIK